MCVCMCVCVCAQSLVNFTVQNSGWMVYDPMIVYNPRIDCARPIFCSILRQAEHVQISLGGLQTKPESNKFQVHM